MLSAPALAAPAVALTASSGALAALVPALACEVLSLGLAELLRSAAPPLSRLLVLAASLVPL